MTTTQTQPDTGTATAPSKPRTDTSRRGGNETKTPAKPPQHEAADGTLAGLLVPGGVITGLIGLCWLTHRFGLSLVLGGIVVCAIAASAVIGKRKKRNPNLSPRMRPRGPTGSNQSGGRQRRLTGASSGAKMAPSGNVRKPTSGGANSPRSGGAKNAGRSRLGGGLGAGFGAAKSSSRSPIAGAKPLGLGGAKKPTGGLLGAAKNGPAGSRSPGSGLPLGKRQKPAGGSANKPGIGPLLGGARNTPGGGHRPLSPRHSGGGANTLKAAKQRANKSRKNGDNWPASTADKKSPAAKPNKPLGVAASLRRLAQAAKKNRNANVTTPRQVPTTARKALPPGATRRTHLSKAARWAGKKVRKHTSPQTRLRIRNATQPLRHAANRASRVASPLLARAWRYGSRGLLAAHMALGSIRYSNRGPNWLRPLAKVFHVLTTPAARAIAWSGSIGWLNRWMYQHTSDQPARRNATTTPTGVTPAQRGAHTPISRPALSAGPLTGGTTVTNIQPAMPLVNAAEAVRLAGAMLIINPADNMVGYEMTIRQLADLQSAIASVIRAAAASTRENFKVNPAVSEAYDDTAAYMDSIAARLGSIPYLYRVIHAEQIDNIENPTIQGAKWDIGANQ